MQLRSEFLGKALGKIGFLCGYFHVCTSVRDPTILIQKAGVASILVAVNVSEPCWCFVVQVCVFVCLSNLKMAAIFRDSTARNITAGSGKVQNYRVFVFTLLSSGVFLISC
ncbi:hypothetical protein XENOCAPTIV_009757 [Xenoophorus captivus]|uniref:Uncharacterized protein n=1 Tax=Xenoophorus captivus TaxID=1517983 RepID=A0ABV0RWB4_9TELE